MIGINQTSALTIEKLVAIQAARTPEAVVLLAPHRRALTYHQLHAQIHAVAGQLGRLGIGRNDRVALVLPNGPEAAAAFLAVAACATSAPLNPGCQADEFEFYLTDLKARAVIVEAGVDSPARVAAKACGIPIFDLSPQLNAEAGLFVIAGVPHATISHGEFGEPYDIAVALHTSGTTSCPKLVPLTHSNLCTSALNIRASLALTEEDRCLNVMPLFHIHGLVGALLSSLAAGGSVVCTTGYAPEFLFPWLKEFRPTWYTAAPTMHQAIVTRAQAHIDAIRRYPLRFIRSSSAALTPQVMTELEGIFHAPVIESYGMTEAAHQIASNPLPPGQRKPGSVGKAAGPEIAIMDEVGNLLPARAIGEIVIRGENVTAGYEKSPTANSAASAYGWFRTGDQGYLDTDRYLFLTGRIKEIVNRGGEKISLREIDTVLLDHPEVRQAAAFPIPHPTLGEDIAAAIVVLNKHQVTETMIHEYLLAKLAQFKVPNHLWVIDELPKGSTGKIQRMKLAEAYARRLPKQFVEPRNEFEMMVANIFANVLGVQPVSASDNFFELGGDSLRAMQVISRIRDLFHLDLQIVTLFQKATVVELAGELTRSMESIDPRLQREASGNDIRKTTKPIVKLSLPRSLVTFDRTIHIPVDDLDTDRDEAETKR